MFFLEGTSQREFVGQNFRVPVLFQKVGTRQVKAQLMTHADLQADDISVELMHFFVKFRSFAKNAKKVVE